MRNVFHFIGKRQPKKRNFCQAYRYDTGALVFTLDGTKWFMFSQGKNTPIRNVDKKRVVKEVNLKSGK